ncbi:hypothetical protein QTP70_031470, partial [Hemibagrus guttatus]
MTLLFATGELGSDPESIIFSEMEGMDTKIYDGILFQENQHHQYHHAAVVPAAPLKSTNFIPDRSRPGLKTTAIGAVDLQGAGGNWATVGRRSRGGRRVHRQREKRKGKSVGLRIGTLNVGTMTGKGRELADVMERRKVDILCVQETRWKGSKAHSIGAGFKLFYYGVDSKRNGVGVVLKEEFVRNVLEVKRVSDRVMSLKLKIEGVMLNVVSGYAPQVGCELEEKERFWSELDEVMESIPTGERVVIGADFNGHVGEGNTGDEEVMGKFGVKERNLEGQTVVDFAKRMDMVVINTYFQKREEHRVTYKSGGRRTQVVLPDDWETTAEVIRETGRKVLGVSSGRRKEDKETWWWNEEVQDSIQRKRLAKKKWDMDRTEENRQEYKELQRRVKREVSKAKQKAYEELYTRLDTREGEKDLYRLARQRDRDGKDVQQVRVIKDRDGRVLTSEESVQRRWKEYFEELMNEENEREKRVEGVNSVEQNVDKIRKDEVRKALKRMKSGKAVGPDDIPVEVWKCLGEAAVEFLANLFNRVLESERMPEEWRRSVLVPIFKNKGDVQSCSNYRGIKLMSHTMKVWERVVEARLRKVVEICEQQYGFMPRKSTTDAIFALRILMEKYRDGQRKLHCVFVDLEKAYDRVPREELWYCMRKSGVAEKYVRVVQDMYERSRTVVRCAVGQTEEFKVEVGLHQGSALSPFLFAIVMDQLSEEVRQESPWTMMFADDIVICSESREQVEENLERWRFALERRGMKVSRSKTEYMCVNEREGSGTVRLQGEEVKKVQEFKYLGSTVQSNGECGKEVKKRVQAGWNGWRKVWGVLCDQKISARIKGKVYRTVVRPAMLYGLETVSLRKRQESELEVAELKMLRFSLGVTRLDRIRNEYIRGTAHVGRLGDKVREARLRWFGHVQRREKNLQKLHKSLTVIMSLLYIYILWVTACVDCNVSPTDAAESLVTVSAPVGSTVILPCNLTEVFNKTPVIWWQIINRKDRVFERSSNGVSSGSGYEGRVDIPVDELLKGNCSLVLKNVRITDDHLYKTFRMEHVDSTNTTGAKNFNNVSLSVYDQISARVGSTAVLPCEWSHLSIQTPHVQWIIDSETVFERKGKELNQSKGYEGRVDVPEDELLKGNCSLVLKNVTVTDAGNYNSSMLVKDTQKSVLVQKIKLSVDDGISDERGSSSEDSDSHQTGGNIWIIWLCVVGIVLIIGVSVYCYVKQGKSSSSLSSCCSRTTSSTEQGCVVTPDCKILLLSRTNKDFSNSAALCFTESWLNDAIPDSALNLPGFQLFRADQVSAGKSRGGGTCFYINERWCTDVTALKKMCCPDLEVFFINCKPFYSPQEFSSFILMSVYIPPQAHMSSALQHLADQITHTEQQHPDSVIIILGDFNQANLSHELPKFKHISFSTRDKNILDHCYTTIKDAYRSVPRAALGISDHCLVHLLPTYRPKLKSAKPVVRTVKRWTSETEQDLQACFECTDWSIFEAGATDLDELTETVTSYISFCEDMCIPTRTYLTFINDKPWFTAKLRHLRQAKEDAFRNGDRVLYNQARNTLNKEIRVAKKSYRANRSVDDAVNMGLHFILQHLDKSGTYMRLLFVEFSSAFNTIIPTLLQTKLTQLSVPSSICQWITSFLTDRHQLVKLGKSTSYSHTTSTGAPQGCVLSPLLFSLYTNDCTSTDPSVKLLKFADDTTVIGLIQDGDESAYRQEIEELAAWCSLNNLELNTLKRVEMIVDFRRNTPALPPLTIMNSTVPTVESFRQGRAPLSLVSVSAESLWSQDSPVTQSYAGFVEHFKEVFGKPSWDSSVGEELCKLRQGKLMVTEYAIQFRTLAAKSGWNEQALLAAYRQGLSPQVRLHLAAHEDAIGLERLIQLSIRVATRLQSCVHRSQDQSRPYNRRDRPEPVSPPEPAPEPAPEPLQLGTTHLNPTERQRRLTQSLCLYCGDPGHALPVCPIHPPRPMVSTIFSFLSQMKPLTTHGTLTTVHTSVTVVALLDSGSAANFISGTLCRQLELRTKATATPYQIRCITGKPISRRRIHYSAGPVLLQVGLLHVEETTFLVLEESTADIILGRPWLEQHNPILSWSTGKVLKWGDTCFHTSRRPWRKVTSARLLPLLLRASS